MDKSTFIFGYAPNFFQLFQTSLARWLVFLLRLNNNSKFSTEMCQLIKPKTKVNFEGREIFFASGHGRLKWRAETFHSEEPMIIEWIKSFSSQDIFLDVGANVGTYTIAAALRAKQVIAIELDPANIYCLHTNICLNNLQEKVLIVPIASSATKSIQKIFYRDLSLGDALQSVGREQILPTRKNAPFSINQLSIPIDTLFNEYDLPKPTRIKIDVDGNEETVLAGAWQTISQAEEIYFEVNGLEDDLLLLQKFYEYGFSIIKEMPSNVGSVKSDVSRNLLLRKSVS